MTWNKIVIQKARKLNLVKVLSSLKYNLRYLENNNYNVEKLAGVIIKDNFWYDKINKKGGNTIDFFIQFENKSFSNTMRILEKFI